MSLKKQIQAAIKNNESLVVKYADIVQCGWDVLPKRDDFIDKRLNVNFINKIKKSAPILFMPTDYVEKDAYIKNGMQQYRIYLFGILPCGSNMCVVLKNIDVYIDVLCDKKTEVLIREKLYEKDIRYTRMETVKQYKLHGFQKDKSDYLRIYFDTKNQRYKALREINSLNLQTASDDSNYYNKVAREHRFATADWNRITNYEFAKDNSIKCEYKIEVDIGCYEKLKESKLKEYKEKYPKLYAILEKDKTLTCMWDIETYRKIQNGLVPAPGDDDYNIFMICSAFFWHYTDKPLLTVCVVDKPTDAHKDINLIIQCNNEKDLLYAHMKILGRMSPNILGAFNGSDFDWPLYLDKVEQNKLLIELKKNLSSIITKKESEENIEKFNFKRNVMIKISAENTIYAKIIANFPGMLDTDVLPVFTKLYPKAEVGRKGSLNFFLKSNRIETKADMPYNRMFKIYERAIKLNASQCHCENKCMICKEKIKLIDCKFNKSSNDVFLENTGDPTNYSDELLDNLKNKCCYCGKMPQNKKDMADVAYYCVIDCIRPQQLYVKRAIINEKRELSNMSYVGLYASFYNADGMKVRNVVGSYCYKSNIAFSNSTKQCEKDNYPGAWVFPPIRGLHSDNEIPMHAMIGDQMKEITFKQRPITGLDYSSLYPSLMMTYNLSPDKIVYDEDYAKELKAEGYDIHHIAPFEYKRGAIRHTAQGWTVRHNNIIKKTDTHIKNYVIENQYELLSDTENFTKGSIINESQYKSLNDKSVAKITKKIKEVYGRKSLKNENFGIFPYIVKKLFDKRKPLKRKFVQLETILEKMDKENLSEYDIGDSKTNEIKTRDEIEFLAAKIDSKQKALKVLANTFYGESGNNLSPMYELLVAASITCAGQANIKKVARYVEDKGYRINYGDTDSLYLSCPDRYFEECDKEYYNKLALLNKQYEGEQIIREAYPDSNQCSARALEFKKKRTELRVQWWTKQVQISMTKMKELEEEVAHFLLNDNKTMFLKMAYEEVGFPTVLCGKKKYFMTPHIGDVNFYPKKYFIKGIDFIKQGQTGLVKELGMSFIKECLAPENERTIIEIIEDKIKQFYEMNLEPSMFVQTAQFKPNKKNIKVHTFVDRMKKIYEKFEKNIINYKRYFNDESKFEENKHKIQALYEPPEGGDKFQYVVVKKGNTYDIRGRKITLKVGDKMEYIRVFNASQNWNQSLEIDRNHYLASGVIGLFSRFIAYHDKFQPSNNKFICNDANEKYKRIDKYSVDEAKKYLKNLCKKLSGEESFDEIGKKYKSVWRNTEKINKAQFEDITETNLNLRNFAYISHDTYKIYKLLFDNDLTIIDKYDKIDEIIEIIAENTEMNTKDDFKYLDKTIADIGIYNTQNKCYNLNKISLLSFRIRDLKIKRSNNNKMVSDIIGKISSELSPLINNLYDYIYEIRDRDDVDDKLNDIKKFMSLSDENINLIFNLLFKIDENIAIERLKIRLGKMLNYVRAKHAKINRIKYRPDIDSKELAHADVYKK